MSQPRNFDGRVAIVTGGSRGIGLAIARALLERGSRVTIAGVRKEHVDQACTDLGSADRVEGLTADVRDPAQVDRMVSRTVERFGGLDILVNNAAVGHFAQVANTSLDVWHDTVGTNLNGVFYGCRAAIPHLRARGGGWIINISSLAGKNPFVGGAAYCASKAALNAFSEALMLEVRHDGIRVSCVMPGSVNTGFGGLEAADDSWKLTAGDVAQVVMDLIAHDPRSLPSRVEIRPSKPPRK